MSRIRVTRTRFLRRTQLALGGALGTLFFAGAAGAQLDIAPPLPNVLLLVNTSGSMEFQANGNPVTCNPGNTASTNDRSRWVNVLEVLTGTFSNYTCQSVDRASDNYKQSEYQLKTGVAPYDYRYTIPYHRPLTGGSTGCAAAPTNPASAGLNSTNAFIYPTTPVSYHVYSPSYSSAGAACTQSQTNDGILDAFGTRVRFGLMTFDTEVNPGTGFAAGGSPDPDTGQAGLYSYVINQAVGRPMGCATPSVPQEVGARNGAAPAWEGRMINFGNPNDAEKAYETQAQRIQQVLVATRPFGATPIAGMLHDAEDFFWNDTMVDPGVVPAGAPTPFNEFGPANDPFLGCDTPRQQIIILLTDGEPNMDLRPQCSDAVVGGLAAGECPFQLPNEITTRLFSPGSSSTRKPIKTYVVGFGIEIVDADFTGTANDNCGSVTQTQCADPRVPTNIPLQACCNLHKIAIAGGGQAFFASNAEQLRSAISDILRRSVPTTTRTQPATSGGGAIGGAFRFFSGFEVGQLAPWNAQLTRERWECVAPTTGAAKVPTRQTFDASKGDDFVENVNADSFPSNTVRRFYTVVGMAGSTVKNGVETVRRGIVTDDGAGTLAPTSHGGLTASSFASAVPDAALAIPSTSWPTSGVSPAVTSDPQAAAFFLKWLTGANAVTDKYHRCRNSSTCELIGDIYHSTPQVVGAPSERLQDESYQQFATDQAKRPVVLYTSTNDGFLHAFKVATNDPGVDALPADRVLTKKSNELWAFAPPAVLPSVYNLYPFNHQHLLDGVATIQDVVATVATSGPPTSFERSAADAQSGKGTWRTVLVQGFGLGRGGYFALDVTNPVPGSPATDTDKGGPRFLWQLTRDAAGSELFGRAGANPAIATLFFDPTGGTDPREIPVAILPGGHGGTPRASTTGCPEAPNPARTFTGIDAAFPPRGRVKCYDWGSGNSEIGARSLTIVRLDTGEIIRTFRQKQTEVASTTLRTRVTEVEIDSPITGQPVAFPGLAGAVADRVLVGDEDGRLWKVNVASTKPADWTMKLFFDLYPSTLPSTTGHGFADGQPLATPPVLSVDEVGNMTVNIASGDQDALGYSTSMTNYVYSITEDFGLARTTATSRVNWLKSFSNGARAVGPLVLFNSNLYFSTFAGNNSADRNLACKPGTSTLWGMNYVRPASTSATPDLSQGGLAALPSGGTLVQSVTRADRVIFGVTLAQQPTCFSRLDDNVGNDLFGYKGQTTVSQVTPAKFELVVQTSATGATTGQAPVQETLPLEQPSSFARVLSWASIIE